MDFGVKRPLFGKEIPMRTVNEVSKLTGVSIRPLQYYDMVEKELLCLQQKQLRYIANKRAQLSVLQKD